MPAEESARPGAIRSSKSKERELREALFRLRLRARHQPAGEPGGADSDAARHRAHQDHPDGASARRPRAGGDDDVGKVQSARGRRRQQQDGQDRRGRRRSAWSSTRSYKKYVKRRAQYKAHDENNRCGVGDRVRDRRDPPAQQGQALARAQHRREGELSAGGATRQRETDMVQTETVLDVADNSGARRVLCIKVLGRLAAQVRLARRHHRRVGEGSDPELEGEEGRRDEGGDRAHGEGSRPRRTARTSSSTATRRC